jgi:hypothetical protein
MKVGQRFVKYLSILIECAFKNESLFYYLDLTSKLKDFEESKKENTNGCIHADVDEIEKEKKVNVFE